ncbi:MAG TPA: hypothetical protein VEW42_03225 [Candidatus Eisenbacteria bacterium]|nr:hypothetical protein [Candidatus Eisenbacteria bacterium]
MERPTPHVQAVNRINTAISARRDEFVSQYRAGHMGRRALTYEPELDRGVYQTLKEHRHEGTAYEHVRNNLNGYTTFQVETFIGERLNVGLSQFRYDLRDGVMYGEGMTDPLIDMIARGKDCRDEVVHDVDKPRQQAEIEQFTKIQEVFGNPHADIGTTIVSISPPGGEGSAYVHNFYDVFVLSEDKDSKERYVAARRFASELCPEEYEQKAAELIPGFFTERTDESLDSYFLSHPLVLDATSNLSNNPEEIHAHFHKGKDFLSTEDFGEVKRQIAGLIVSYVNTLVETPEDDTLLKSTLNVIMRKADDVADSLRHPHRRAEVIASAPIAVPLSRGQMLEEGKKSVRQVTTGCGDSSAFETTDTRASNMATTFSMRDFGKDKLGNRVFDCPDCGEMNVRPVNELVNNCQNCGSDKVGC